MDREYYQRLSEAYQQVEEGKLSKFLKNLTIKPRSGGLRRGRGGSNTDVQPVEVRDVTPPPRQLNPGRENPGQQTVDTTATTVPGSQRTRQVDSQGNPVPRRIPNSVRNTALVGAGGAALYAASQNNSGLGTTPKNTQPGGGSDDPGRNGGSDDPGRNGRNGDAATTPGTASTVPSTPGTAATTPSVTAGTPGGQQASAARPAKRSDRLALALKATQDQITSDRQKAGEKIDTIKKPGRLQSKIGTDFSDVTTESYAETIAKSTAKMGKGLLNTAKDGANAVNKAINTATGRKIKEDLNGFMDELMETPKGELHLSPEAKVVKRNLRDGDDATPAATARRQFRSAALRGVKKPKPIKKPRQETRMPGEQLKDMNESLPKPKVNYLKDMDPYDPRRAPRQHAPGSPLPPPTPGIPDFLMKKASKKKDKKYKSA